MGVKEGRPLTTRELQDMNSAIQNGVSGVEDFSIDAGPRRTNLRPFVSPYNPMGNREQDVRINVSSPDDYWGKSHLDEKFADSVDLSRLQDIRARNQGGLEQVGAGLLKGAVTAGTTFLNGTVGSMWGLTEALSNIGNKEDSKTFFQHMWDNEFNAAMASAQKDMERITPNYYTEEELTNPWYKNIFTWNFLGDKILKNAGFTVGAMATMTVPGAGGLGFVGEGLDFAATTLGRAIAATRLYSQGAHAAMKAIETGKQIGGIANKFVHAFVSANGEAAIEAINAVKDNSEAQRANLNTWAHNATQEAYDRYNTEKLFDPEGAFTRYTDTLNKIDQTQQATLDEITRGESDLGNSVYWANVGLLMLTNELEFDKYIKGGYNRQKGIQNFIMKVEGQETKDVREFARGLARGKATLEIPEEIGKKNIGRIVGGTLGRAAAEGFEEGAQRLISDSGQMQDQAKVNQAIQESLSGEDEDSILLRSINPSVTEDLVDRMKAIGNAWNEGFGTWASPGWEEVLLGGLTGGLGTVSVTTNKQGKWNVWQGGFIEELRRPQEELQEYTEMLEKFNKKLGDDDFVDRTRHAVAALSTAEAMQDALNNEDIMRFKNEELLSIFNDTLYFQNIGGLDAYKDFYEELSKQVTDEDVQYVRNAVRDRNTGKSYLDTKTNEEVKKDIQDKAKSTFDKIQASLDMYTFHDIKYRQKLVDAASNLLKEDEGIDSVQRLAEWSLRELSAKALLSADLQRRKGELEEQRDAQDSTSILLRGDNISKEIDKLDTKIRKIDEAYKDWIAHPKKAVENTKALFDTAEKIDTAKDAIKSLERLKQAKTLQEVADFYHYLDPEKAGAIFDKALEEADPETKQVLEQYKPFIASTEALRSLVQENGSQVYDAYMKEANKKDTPEEVKALIQAEATMMRAGYIRDMNRLLDQIVNNFAEDPDTVLTKKNLQSAIRDLASDLLQNPTEYFNITTPQAQQYVEGLSKELTRISKQLHRKSTAYQRHEEFSKIVEQEKKTAERKVKEKEIKKQEKQEPAPTIATPESTEVPQENKQPVYYNEDGEVEDTSDWSEEEIELGLKNGIIYTEDPTKGESSSTPLVEEIKEEPEVETKVGTETKPELSPKSEEDRAKQEAEDDGGQGMAVSLEGASIEEADDIEDMNDDTIQTPNPEGVTDGIDMVTADEKPADATPPVTSLRATFSRYIKGRLKEAGELISHLKDGTLEREMKRSGRNIDVTLMQQRHLADFMKAKGGKLNVRYVAVHNNAGNIVSSRKTRKPFILLATPYDSIIQKMFNPMEEQDLAGNLIKGQDGKQYVVVGALNYSERDTAGEKGFNKISEILSKDSKENPKAAYVVHDPTSDGVDNFIYDMNSGYVVRREENEKKEMSPANISLKQLFERKSYPQKKLTYGDLRWVILMGKTTAVSSMDVKFIGFRKNEEYRLPAISQHPGKVYLYIKASNGVYIPQYVIPQRLRDITSKTVLAEYDKILDQIVDAKDVAARKAAFAALRKKFVFSAQKSGEGTKGTNIFYDETTDSVTASVGDQMINDGVAITFNLDREQMKQVLDNLIKQTNPRISIKGETLLQNPGYYIDNDLIKVNLRYLGTVEATAFAYPIGEDGVALVDFKRGPIVTKSAIPHGASPVYVATQPYYLRKESGEINLYDQNGIRVTDDTIIAEALRQEKLQGMRARHEYVEVPPVNASRGISKSDKLYRYYIIDASEGLVYTERNTGSFERLSSRELSIFNSRWDAYKKEQESKELAAKKLAEPTPTPQEAKEEPHIPNDQEKIDFISNYIVSNSIVSDQSPKEIRQLATEVFKLNTDFTQEGYNNLAALAQRYSKSKNQTTKRLSLFILQQLGQSVSSVEETTVKKEGTAAVPTRKNPIFEKVFSADEEWSQARNDLYDILEKTYPNIRKMSMNQLEDLLTDPKNTYYQMYLNASTYEEFQDYLDKIDECGL